MRALGIVAVVFLLASNIEAGESYIKGGWLLHVDEDGEIDRDDRWWAAFGHGWHFANAGLIGFEISGAYREDTIGGKIRSRVAPIDALLDVRWKKPAGSVRPYLSGGIGLASALVWTEVEHPLFSPTFAWERALGHQVLGGVDLGSRFLVEAVFERTFATAASVQVNPVGPEHVLSIAAGVTW